eukprot:g11586.t1
MGGSSSQRSHDVALSFSEKAEKAMPSDDLLAVAASRIPAAGAGLFAAADIPRDSVITHYSGRVLTTKDAMRLPDKTYLMRLGEGSAKSAKYGKSAKSANSCHEIRECRAKLREFVSPSYRLVVEFADFAVAHVPKPLNLVVLNADRRRGRKKSNYGIVANV